LTLTLKDYITVGNNNDWLLSWPSLRFHYRIMGMDFFIRLMRTVTSNKTATIS